MYQTCLSWYHNYKLAEITKIDKGHFQMQHQNQLEQIEKLDLPLPVKQDMLALYNECWLHAPANERENVFPKYLFRYIVKKGSPLHDAFLEPFPDLEDRIFSKQELYMLVKRIFHIPMHRVRTIKGIVFGNTIKIEKHFLKLR